MMAFGFVNRWSAMMTLTEDISMASFKESFLSQMLEGVFLNCRKTRFLESSGIWSDAVYTTTRIVALGARTKRAVGSNKHFC